MMARSRWARGDGPLHSHGDRLAGGAGGRVRRSGLRPHRRRVLGRFRGRLRASAIRARPRGGDGRGRAVGRFPRGAGGLAVADRVSAGDGLRRRPRNPRRAAARCRDRHRDLGHRARSDGGAGGTATARRRRRPGRCVRDLPRPCPWRRASARRQRGRLLGRLRGRDRALASRRHQLRPARPLAGRAPCRARRRRGDRARRGRLSERSRMSGLFRAVLAVAFLAWADPAFAHLPIGGVGGFYGGLLHPILVPPHALSVVALGLFIGRQRERRIASLSFAAALLAGLVAIALAVEMPVGNVMLANTALLGVLVAAAWTPPQPLGWLLAAIAGATLALDSPPQAITIAEANLMLVGTALGACLAVAVVGAIASYLTGARQQIAVRVLASWIAASAILVLAMSWR